jgi:integral membrane protein
VSGAANSYRAAVTRYRVMAYVVGVGLLVLVLVGVPLNHLADQPAVVAVVGPAHGFLYIVYLLTALDLAVRSRWALVPTVLVLLAGTVPFVSFVAERRVVRSMLRPPGAGRPAAPTAAGPVGDAAGR